MNLTVATAERDVGTQLRHGGFQKAMQASIVADHTLCSRTRRILPLVREDPRPATYALLLARVQSAEEFRMVDSTSVIDGVRVARRAGTLTIRPWQIHFDNRRVHMSSRNWGSLAVWLALIVGSAAGCAVGDRPVGAEASTGVTDGDPAAPSAPSDVAGGTLRKAMPVKPPDHPGVTGGALPAKPAGPRVAAVALPAWTVSLTASPASPWAATYTVLTATANMDVCPTQYFIRIWDAETGSYLASCGSGTTCSVSVTRANVDSTSFTAVIADAVNPPVASSSTDVYWHVAGVKLTQTFTTAAIGATATLTASTDYDIITSPFYVQIYDDTSAALLQTCGGGTRCTVAVSQTTATTHRYRACFSGFGTAMPPPNLFECTEEKFITWSNTRIAVALSASPGTVTATSSVDVGATPYYIQIFDIAGTRLAVCGSGTTCTAPFNAAWGGSHVLAMVGPSSATPNVTAAAISTVTTLFGLGDGSQGAPVGPGPSPGGPPGDPPFAPPPLPILQ